MTWNRSDQGAGRSPPNGRPTSIIKGKAEPPGPPREEEENLTPSQLVSVVVRKLAQEKASPVRELVCNLLSSSILLAEDWDAAEPAILQDILGRPTTAQALARLVEQRLLTRYQADRIEAGTHFGLVLGNYRVLDRLGAGGMGVVFKGEHLEMRRPVAIKVFHLTPEQDPRLLSRFRGEMRAVAQLQHPNIVAAFDAGKVADPKSGLPVLRYFVMEFVPGQDLEAYVKEKGPFPAAKACDLTHQVACALAEVHKYHLVHRDLKPSNILLTAEDHAKLLDFGLARHFHIRLTEPGIALGTIDYLAPEQARDASKVDIRADIYGLGGTLFWCLTGRVPFPAQGSIAEDLARRFTQPPPSVRESRPEVPAELDAVVARMLAINPEERFPSPAALKQALLPFLRPEAREHLVAPADQAAAEQRALAGTPGALSRIYRVLVVDDEPAIRTFSRHILQAEGIQCEEAPNGARGLEAARAKGIDLVLLDVDMPNMNGIEVLRRLREAPPCPHLKVLMISGQSSSDELARILLAGADDYLTKPFSMIQLQGRVKAALRLKEAQDRSEMLNAQLLAINAEQERSLSSRDSDLVHARNALVLALAKLVEHRDNETGGHLTRLQRYCRCLGEEAATTPTFAGQIDPAFVEMLVCCAPLHDIGKLGLPDHILLKPGKLTPDERILMQAHTTIGADTLKEIVQQHAFARVFLQTAIDITRHHHERYDGTGYPDRLAGSSIPLAARIVAIADVYDALRSRRVYKPALSHAASLQLMTEASAGHFDPALLRIFQRCAPEFERIFQEVPD
jgi:putative two-component system response regulator